MVTLREALGEMPDFFSIADLLEFDLHPRVRRNLEKWLELYNSNFLGIRYVNLEMADGHIVQFQRWYDYEIMEEM